MKDQSARRLTALGIVLATGSLLPFIPSLATGEPTGFQPYKNAQLGFALAKPDGWSVRTEGPSIWVESPDKSEVLLTEFFHAAPGDTAERGLESIGNKYAAQFPHAIIDNIKPVQSKGNEIIAAMHYDGPNGPAQIRVLCSIINGKGLIYVMAAPSEQFNAERPKLVHIAQSLVFSVPKGANKSGGGGSSHITHSNSGGNSKSNSNGASDSVTPAQIAATARSIHWVTWSDPKEKAFDISVPQGWQVAGGTFRDGNQVNFTYTLAAPRNDIAIVIGSASSLMFSTPGPAYAGIPEGQGGILHYMRAPEFNEKYMQLFVSKAVKNLEPGQGQEFPQLSKEAATQMSQMDGGTTQDFASIGLTPFKGTDSFSGKPVAGIVMSETEGSKMQGVASATWGAQPKLMTWQTGDAQESIRIRTAMAVFAHVQQSFDTFPQWAANQQQTFQNQMNHGLDAANAHTAAIGERSKQIAASSAAAEDAIMGRYHTSHGTNGGAGTGESAGDAQQSAFIGFIGDRTNVSGSDGQKYNVGSGYSNYYKNDRTGTIMGTNSAYSPGVDFTPLTEN